MVKKNKQKFNGFKKFFGSVRTLVIALILLCIVLLLFNRHLLKSNKVYTFSGKSEYVNIINGVISLNYDVNLLAGSDVSYINEDDYQVIKYRIGYFIPKGGDFLPLAVKEGADEIGFSLKGLINEESAYNIFEPYRNKHYFTAEKIKYLDRGLCFIIEATTVDGENIYSKINMNVQKVSR